MKLTRRAVLAGAGAMIAVPTGIYVLDRARAVEAGPTREIAQVVPSTPSRDGAGVKLRRALGGQALGMLDPFLLLDEIKSDDPNDYLAGFPDHPHRGFETVTYMIHGAMEHRDSMGNHGRLGPGSAQWMTAGHGIVHSEMPKQDRGLMWGFQLWVNLPKTKKLVRPRYQDIAPDRIPEVELDRARVRVVAGRAHDVTGPVSGIDVEPLFLDLALEKGARVVEPLPLQHAAFAYVIDGAVRFGAARREVKQGELAVLGEGSTVITACDAERGRALLFAGRSLREPVARYGPFVMNTREEIQQAIDDYRSGRLTSEG